MQYILWKSSISPAPTPPRSVSPRCQGRYETGARWERGARGTAGHYLTGRESTIHQQSLCGGGGRMEERWRSRERIWVHTQTQTQQVQRLVSVWRKSREAPRSCWHGKTEARKKPKKSSRSDLELRPRAATTIIKRWPRHHHRQKPTLRWAGVFMDCDLNSFLIGS